MMLGKIKSLICISIYFFSATSVTLAQSIYMPGTTTNLFMPFPQPNSLYITSGKGWIVIYYDGRIELKDTNLDEAAKEFWNKIAIAFPVFKQNIIDEYKKELENIRIKKVDNLECRPYEFCKDN